MAFAMRLLQVNFPARRRRLDTVRVRVDPLGTYDDHELRQRFRFDRASLHYILREINTVTDDLQPESTQNSALSPMMQLCAALSFYGHGDQ